MLPLCILALLVYTTLAVDPLCKEGQEVHTRSITKDDDIVGSWNYIYIWNNRVNESDFLPEFRGGSLDRELKCSIKIDILPVDHKYVKEKQEKCGNKPVSVNWEDAKWRMTSPLIGISDITVFMGEKENWYTEDCQEFPRVEFKKVSEDIMVYTIPEKAQLTQLISRKPIRLNEAKCLAHNLNVGKGFHGTGLCF